MSTKTSDHDVPMSPGAEVLRARLQRTETTGGGRTAHGEDSTTWGDFADEAVWDNENYDDPRRTMSLADLAKLEPGLKVIRYQNQDPKLEALQALTASPMFAAVEYLDLRRNFRSPGDAEIAKLVESGALAHIRLLSLDSCYSVADATMKAIGSGAMPKLEALDIGSTAVTAEGLAALSDASKTPALQVVVGMFVSKLSAAGVEALSEARPELNLQFTG